MTVSAHIVTVNGIEISEKTINEEVQYHPANSLSDARYEATRALVIRELLLQRASSLGLCSVEQAIKNTDDVIEVLLRSEMDIPDVDEDTCREYYDEHKLKFVTSPLFEAAHILYLASTVDELARRQAMKKAELAINVLVKNPEKFETIAREESACSSAAQGGSLGQICRGQTMPGFELALFEMQEGELSEAPVSTAVGYHIIKVLRRAEGSQLPFEAVSTWIERDVSGRLWNKVFKKYVQLLVANAEIDGFQIGRIKTLAI